MLQEQKKNKPKTLGYLSVKWWSLHIMLDGGSGQINVRSMQLSKIPNLLFLSQSCCHIALEKKCFMIATKPAVCDLRGKLVSSGLSLQPLCMQTNLPMLLLLWSLEQSHRLHSLNNTAMELCTIWHRRLGTVRSAFRNVQVQVLVFCSKL